MPAQYTDITILLDRSGSMESIKPTMESALDELLLQHKKVPSTRLSLIQFDDEDTQEVVYSDRPVGEAPRTVIEPRGSTPLLDALCVAIDNTGRRLHDKPAMERPDQVLFIIITDGMENASRTYKHADVRRRTQHQTDSYKWQFVYLGANQDAIQEAASIGIAAANSISYAANAAGTHAVMVATVQKSVDYVQQVNRGSARSLAFSTDERVAAAATDADEDDLWPGLPR
jgi:Mg-chelatase subunit ChlD